MYSYISEYLEEIENGNIIVGKWIELFYKKIVEDLDNKIYSFSKKKSERVISFIETFCHHSEGRNDLLKLELWQKSFLCVVFGIIDKEGNRQFREVLLVVGRKNGKSLFAQAIANYCLFADGEYGARIYCLAPKLDQADIIYNAIWQTIESEPELNALTTRRKSDYFVKNTNSTVKKIAFNQKKSDGFNPSLTICDEVSSWRGDAGIKQYEVMKSALGARTQPIILSITTSGYENESEYDELIKRSTRFLFGESKETRLAPFLYMIDDVNKWNDKNELRKSNPNMDVSVKWSYLEEEIAIAEGSMSKKAEFLTKYCNIKQNSSQAWLSAEVIKNACGDKLNIEDFKHSYCVAGLDLSQTTDLTCALVVIEKNNEFYIFSKFFLPSEKIDDAIERDGLPYNRYIEEGWLELSGENFIDYHDCYKWFVELVNKYEILPLKVGYDRYSSQYLIQEMQQFGFQCDDVYQGENLYPVLMEIEGMLKDGVIHIGNNDLLKVHLLNSAIKMSTERGRGKLIKLNPTDHIDGTAALADAMCVRQKWYSEIGNQLKNIRS